MDNQDTGDDKAHEDVKPNQAAIRRDEKRAAALRNNLHRRKQQQRGRMTVDNTSEEA